MKKIIPLLFIIIITIFASCSITTKQNSIEKEIEKAKYCKVKEDCIIIHGKCPFGCYQAINKNEKEKIENLIKDFDSNCAYSCIELKEEPQCNNNRCEIINQ